MIWMTLYFKEVVKQHNTEHWILNHSNVASDKHFNHFSSLDLIYLAWWYSSLKEVVQKRPGHISFNLGPYPRGSCIRYLGVVQVQIFGCWQLDKFCKQKYIHLIFSAIHFMSNVGSCLQTVRGKSQVVLWARCQVEHWGKVEKWKWGPDDRGIVAKKKKYGAMLRWADAK